MGGRTGRGSKGSTAGKGGRSEARSGGRASRRAGRDAGLRDIAGSAPSQLGVSAALRARDVNRPSDDDLAAAERDLVIVRRNWKPAPEDRGGS